MCLQLLEKVIYYVNESVKDILIKNIEYPKIKVRKNRWVEDHKVTSSLSENKD